MIEAFVRSPRAQAFVIREWFTNDSSIGNFLIPKLQTERLCYSLEDTVRHGADGILQAAEKIQDRTAIPTGVYELELDVSGRFGFCPFILNVPLFIDVRVHWGNTAADTRGCILVGRTRSENAVGESKLAFRDLMMNLVPMRRLEKIYLEVIGGPTAEDLARRAA